MSKDQHHGVWELCGAGRDLGVGRGYPEGACPLSVLACPQGLGVVVAAYPVGHGVGARSAAGGLVPAPRVVVQVVGVVVEAVHGCPV